MSGNPVAVTLLGEDSYTRLVNAASSLDGMVTLSDGTKVTPSECFRELGQNVVTVALTIVIVNGLRKPLTVTQAGVWLKHANELLYPHVAGGASMPVSEIDNMIPGYRPDPLTGAPLYGAGVYQFEKNNAWYLCDGALELSGEGPLLGISWSGKDFGVTADMSAYSSDLQTFYNQTADVKTVAYSDNGKVSIRGVMRDPTGVQVVIIAVGYK